jgi:hypothetical protein
MMHGRTDLATVAVVLVMTISRVSWGQTAPDATGADEAVEIQVETPGALVEARQPPVALGPGTIVPPRVVRPLLGLRLGLEVGGFETTPLMVAIEGGITLWDQLGIALRLGTTVDGSIDVGLPAGNGHGAGVVSASSSTLSLGLELRYRLHLSRGRVPISIDLAAGVVYAANIVTPQGFAFYANDAACGVLTPSCAVGIGPTPERTVTHGVGASFGIDLRVGYFLFGYRFTPAALAHDLPTTHQLGVGFVY